MKIQNKTQVERESLENKVGMTPDQVTEHFLRWYEPSLGGVNWGPKTDEGRALGIMINRKIVSLGRDSNYNFYFNVNPRVESLVDKTTLCSIYQVALKYYGSKGYGRMT